MSMEAATEVIEATDQDFEQTVLQKSMEVPVLVDFWAPWCAPCRTLGPTLEKLAAESNGGFLLAKVNMDENPALAQALQIQSIPAVKLIMNGQIKDEFMGAYPEAQVREFLAKNLPSEQELEATAGMAMLQAGDADAAAAAFRATLAEDPDNAKARVGLGHILADQGNWVEAKSAIENVEEGDEVRHDLARLQAKLLLLEHAGVEAELLETLAAQPNDLAAKFALACRLGCEGRHGEAMELFLEIVKTDRKFQKDAGRRGMIAMFDLLPPESPLEGEYRNKLSSILFS